MFMKFTHTEFVISSVSQELLFMFIMKAHIVVSVAAMPLLFVTNRSEKK